MAQERPVAKYCDTKSLQIFRNRYIFIMHKIRDSLDKKKYFLYYSHVYGSRSPDRRSTVRAYRSSEKGAERCRFAVCIPSEKRRRPTISWVIDRTPKACTSRSRHVTCEASGSTGPISSSVNGMVRESSRILGGLLCFSTGASLPWTVLIDST